MRFEPIRDFSKSLKMNKNQEAKLEEAVLKDLVWIAKEQLTSSKEEVKKVLTAKTAAGMPHKTWLNQLEMLEKRIKKKIALEVYPKYAGYDGRFLRQWWRCNLDPSFLRGLLGTKEIGLLKTLTKDSNPENEIDFEAIAAEISTKLKIQKRHKFQLFQYYQKNLNMKNRTFGWAKAEEERLQNLYKEKSTDHNMPKKQEIWNQIRPAFPGRSVSQMETKLKRLSTPAKSPAKCLPAAIKTVVTRAVARAMTTRATVRAKGKKTKPD
ncbi:hypothetical protein DAPPUDRAFT_317653 [Daphnia pulex]|uniref:Uncharacterized protein n=1 Tax=Daphnia pulex TaxID=6669 RepID=E9GGL4_DAPPU|nr:hypothetical protein DAPPUDRAFT_317653 [Daphnia pulex]|eukprot:EFX81411.1 hypothetical protein DAPPUDRAFT_317653 [Daphnia pulex]